MCKRKNADTFLAPARSEVQAEECFAFHSEDLEINPNFRDAYLWEPKHPAKKPADTWERQCSQKHFSCGMVQGGSGLPTHTAIYHTHHCKGFWDLERF